MSTPGGFPGFAGLGGVFVLLFLEEAGVPLPFAPGEAVLIAAGLLVASGSAPAWLVFITAYCAVLAGSLTGFLWAGYIGKARLRRLAVRLHAASAYDRAVQRLGDSRGYEIGLTRLIPGLRIYTTLVAGAVGVPLRRFLLGIAPAVAVWALVFMALGIFVGAPAAHLLGRLEAWALRGAELIGVLLIFAIALRYVPSVRPREPRRPFSRRRRLLAEVVDVCAVVLVVLFLSTLTGLVGRDFDSFFSGVAIYTVLAVAYVVVARRSLGFTLGEMLLDVRYRRYSKEPLPT